jgi:hypothetical protein
LIRARAAAAARFLAVLGLSAAAAGCAGSGDPGGGAGPPQSAAPLEFTGSWRVYSETLFFDAGGSGGSDSGASTTRELDLNEDGRWEFGSSNGAWHVTTIDPADWSRWGVEEYGPQRKIVLEGWAGDVADGPIEESDAGVDFLWVIYRVDEPGPGVVQMKFGHP